MNVLVTGGAGYVGSHTAHRLRQAGHWVVVLDNLSHGRADAIEAAEPGIPIIRTDVRSTDALEYVLGEYEIECVHHFAALADVAESVANPLAYYDCNARGTASLLSAMGAAGVHELVLSSTCATYGEPQGRLTEDSPQLPVNPYGWSKLFAEQMVRDYAATEPRFSFALLRYFNVAGAAHDGTLGERHEPEPHLIPNLLRVARRDGFGAIVFGSDYPTPDGTCIRDYIHVDDVADAHIAVMRALVPGDRRVYNLGIGRGYSVLEVVEAVKRVTGAELNVQFGPRRPGDPAALYCVPWRIARELDWEAKTRTIDEIIETAWAYLRKQA